MKKRYQLPEKDRERMNRAEMVAVRWCLALTDNVDYANTDLSKRLECIPSGKARMRLALGALLSICIDLLGTVPEKQRRTIENTRRDMELRMVPRLTPMESRCIIEVNDLSFLVRYAKKEICSACTLNGDECRSCELYRILESIAPQQEWKASTVCPYLREDWYDR